jgi:hypothetical protein
MAGNGRGQKINVSIAEKGRGQLKTLSAWLKRSGQ